MNKRFLFHAITAFLLVVTAALCAQKALAVEVRITRVELSAAPTNFQTCGQTEISLAAIVSANGPVPDVKYALMHSDGTPTTVSQVTIDHGGETRFRVPFTRGGPEAWRDDVFLRVITRNQTVNSNQITLTGICPSAPDNSAQGHFRVSLTGFVVNHDTSEHLFSIDGVGDEVFALVNLMNLALPNNGLRARGGGPQMVKSPIYGDTAGLGSNSLPGTVQAGEGHPTTGGLVSGNSYPRPGQTLPPPNPAHPQLIPMILWEGLLRRGGPHPNAAVIIPTIWENDNLPDVFDVWNVQVNDYLMRFAATHVALVNGMVSRPLVEQSETVLDTNPLLIDFDRPIGIDGDSFSPFSPGHATFNPAIMFLTYDSAEAAAISRFNRIRAPGVVEITYRDGRNYGPGSYTIFLLVERLP